MPRLAVVNRMNNFGDAMSHMRSLKEYKERRPDITLDFITPLYLHWIAANHTDIFENVIFQWEDPMGFAQGQGYDEIIEFSIDWGRACVNGIIKAWGEKTLGFEPSINKPYWIMTAEEELTGRCQHEIVMQASLPGKPAFRKSIVLQLEAVSDGIRGFLPQDWNRIVDMIPEDVAIFYMAPITWVWGNPLTPRPHLIVLPGYPLGETAGIMKQVDVIFSVHSGPMFLAYAVDSQPIIQFGFDNGGPMGLLTIPDGLGENIFFPSNAQVDWARVQDAFTRYLS